METFLTHSAEETIALGCIFGKKLVANTVICLFGDLAAGKTTLVKGIAKGVANTPLAEVISPTFTYLNIYRGEKTVYHFDLYRLRDADEFLSMGFDEFFYEGGICCLEWSERIESLIPKNAIRITMNHLENHSRRVVIHL